MYIVDYDPNHHFVKLAFSKRVNLEEATQCRAKVEALLPTLPPGFRLLTDLSALEEMDFTCADEIRAVMDLFHKQGVSHVVRVIPNRRKDIGFTTMSYFHYGTDIAVQTVETPAEGLKAITSSS